MPHPSGHIIRRKRVTQAIHDALASHALVVLTAPLGHGKTTIAQELLGDWHGRALYLRLKHGWRDNTDYLWDDACTKLGKQGMPGAGDLKLIGFPGDDARMYRCLTFFRSYFSETPTLLVLDDFHHLDETPAPRFFENLVYEEIPGFNLLLLSRTKPALPLANLKLKGYAAALDSGILDFSRDEARELFDAAGEPDHATADRALDYTQGWAAAMHVCLQSYQADKGIRPVENIDELLSETFAATYSQEDQCLLLQLCVMESFSAEQAVLLTQEKNAPSRLRKLHEQNAFLQYAPATKSYSIHALLRSFLINRLSERTPAACEGLDILALYRRAARCSLQSGNILRALQLYAQAGEEEDLVQILRVFETPGEGFFMLSAVDAVLDIINAIPWALRLRSPIGYIGFLHRHAVRVSREKAGAMLREAQTVFLEQGALPDEVLRKVQGEMELVRAVLSFNDIGAIGECYEKADTFIDGRSSLVNKNMFWTYNCPHSAFLYLKDPGGYAALDRLAADKLIHFQRLSGGGNVGAPELLTAERLLECGKAGQAEEVLHTAKYKALESEQYSAIVAANFTLARRQLAEGRSEGVYELLDLLRKPVEERAHPLLLLNLEVCVGYIASVCNDMNRIPSWLLQHEPLTVRNNQAHAFMLMVRGKAIMALKNWPRLQAFADEFDRQIAPLGCLFGRLHALLFHAVAAAHLRKHNSSLALDYLLRAVDLAKTDGIITSIAEYGPHIYPLLQRLGNLHPEMRDIGPLSRLTKQYAKLGKGSASKLTPHETGIMEMVRSGANNKEIGASLGITQGSVANTLSRIYVKLGVGSRIEAVNKWAEERALGEGGGK